MQSIREPRPSQAALPPRAAASGSRARSARSRALAAAGAAALAFLAGAARGVDAEAPAGADGAALVYDAIPATPAPLEAGLAAALAAREARPLGWTPAGGLLVATRFGDTDQLHLVERPGGERRQVTFTDEPILDAAVSPDPARAAIAYRSDAGDDRWQIHLRAADAPGATRLTDGTSVSGRPSWSNDGRRIAFSSNGRDPASTDVVALEAATGGAPRLVAGGDGGEWEPLDWSPDDRRLLVRKRVSALESHLFLVDLEDGAKREIDAGTTPAAVRDARLSRDGQGAFVVSDRDGEFARLRFVNAWNGEKTVLSAPSDGDVEALAVSRDGRLVAYVGDDGGVSRLRVLEWPSRREVAAPRLPAAGVVADLAFDAESRRLAFSFTAADHPRDAYVLDVTDGRVEAWTHSEPGDVDAARFVAPQAVQVPTFDREDGHFRRLRALLYAPAAPGPHAVVVLLGDGLHGEARPAFDAWIQYLVREAGYAVLAPNLRGARGAGRTVLGLDVGPRRDDVVKDLGALLVWIGAQPALDAKRVAVAGSGYGGYLALAALANYGDRLRGGVDAAGMSDLVSYLADTAPETRGARRAEFGDERNPDVRAFLRRVSPLTDADRINRPLLVIHGSGDREVPLRESTQLVNRLRARGGRVWFLQAGAEGHVWRRQRDVLAMRAVTARFLDSILAPDAAH